MKTTGQMMIFNEENVASVDFLSKSAHASAIRQDGEMNCSAVFDESDEKTPGHVLPLNSSQQSMYSPCWSVYHVNSICINMKDAFPREIYIYFDRP